MSLALPAQVVRALAEGDRWGMEQHGEEISAAAIFVLALRPYTVVEIGVRRGGTVALWSSLSAVTVIGVDLDEDFNRTRHQELKAAYPIFVSVLGDSHDAETWRRVADALGPRSIDFLFIDGDHTAAGVRADFLDYAPLVRPGGWIGFHDIVETDHVKAVGCEVWQVWQAIRGEKVEFVCGDKPWGGLGFVRAGGILR